MTTSVESCHLEIATAAMGTVVSVQLANVPDAGEARRAVQEALAWLDPVEQACSRFRPDGDLQRIATTSPGTVTVSPLCAEVLHLALAVAERTGGAFDPTLGHRLHQLGFTRRWDTGVAVPCSGLHDGASCSTIAPDWRALSVDRHAATVTSSRPVLPDLGAIAKGFAVDLLATALTEYPDLCINAGGDLWCRGVNGRGEAWSAGIPDPRAPEHRLATVMLQEAALCTSAPSGRVAAAGIGHLLDPVTGEAAVQALSVSVMGPSTALADALATAACVMGPEAAAPMLEAEGCSALFLLPNGERVVVAPSAFPDRWHLL